MADQISKKKSKQSHRHVVGGRGLPGSVSNSRKHFSQPELPALVGSLPEEIISIAQKTGSLKPAQKKWSARQLEIARKKLETALLERYPRQDGNRNPYLYGLENISSVGIGKKCVGGRYTDEVALIVTVERKVGAGEITTPARVPPDVDGIPTDVVIGGRPRAIKYDGMIRPATGGISCGNERPGSGSGTITCLVTDGKRAYLLSCNHVLGLLGAGKVGDIITQPSLEDLDDGIDPSLAAIGRLADIFPIDFRPGRTNLIDCALAHVDTRLVSVLNEHYGKIGSLPGRIKPGYRVRKCGRTTEETEGVVRQLDVAAIVRFGPRLEAHFSGLIAVEQGRRTPFAIEGDSGALVLDLDNNPVGMIISSTREWAYAVPMGTILKKLNVSILNQS